MKNPQFIKGGTTRAGKQMLRCCEYGRRFVHDTGSLTFYSHQDSSRWSSFIKSTFEGKSMKTCAEELEVTQKTAFRMRHKLMFFIGEAIPRNTLTDQVEVDEKYFAESHKGLIDGRCLEPLTDIFAAKEVEEKESLSSSESARLSTRVASCADRVKKLIYEDEKANKPTRGISHDQVCVMTGIERGGMVEGWATNTASPTLESAESFLKAVKNESHVWLDGCKAYPSKLEEKNCTYTIVTEETRTKVDHIYSINSFHDYLKDENKAMRGVSSIYINRYASLL
ncbi:MAG: IS1595 family transposase, partial [Solobacterium sp.]|nr:IS1595 family transposase [Solobacterium sp.]